MRLARLVPRPPDAPRAPVVVFDSGAGGLSVLSELRRALPGEAFVYLADQAHVPYGPRSPEELRELLAACADFAFGEGARLFVVACNTASAAALADVRQRFPERVFVGMVPPVKPAASVTRTGKVAVLATPGTLAGGLLEDVIGRFGAGLDVRRVPCPGWVEAVERGDLDSPATNALVAAVVTPLGAQGIDTLVLGCTHYPFLRAAIARAAGPRVAVLDAGLAVARQAARVLGELPSGAHDPPGTHYLTTGDPAAFTARLAQLGATPGPVAALRWEQG